MAKESKLDFSDFLASIGQEARNTPEPTLEDKAAEKALTDQIDTDHDIEKEYEIKTLVEKVNDLRSTRELREKTALWSFIYLTVLSIAVFCILFFAGFRVLGFALSDTVLTTLAGGTFASAIALPRVALNGLFSMKEKAPSK